MLVDTREKAEDVCQKAQEAFRKYFEGFKSKHATLVIQDVGFTEIHLVCTGKKDKTKQWKYIATLEDFIPVADHDVSRVAANIKRMINQFILLEILAAAACTWE